MAESENQATPPHLWEGLPFTASLSRWPEFPTDPNGPWSKAWCVPNGYSLTELPGSIARFEVRQGDRGAPRGGDRSELAEQARSVTGMPDGIRTFHFEALYEPSVGEVAANHYQTLVQWHASQPTLGCPLSSPFKIAVYGQPLKKRLKVTLQECIDGEQGLVKQLVNLPLTTDVWHTWDVAVKWSPDPAVGYIEITHDGVFLGHFPTATLFRGANGKVAFNAWKVGNYRDHDIPFPTAVQYRNVWIDPGE